MSELLRRAHRPFVDLSVRGDGRTIEGIAVPFDDPTPIREMGEQFLEVFRKGSFAQTINGGAERVKLLVSHDRHTLAIGRAEDLREDETHLFARFRVSDTAAGNDALALVRDGVVDALSIGFVPIIDKWNQDRSFVERLEVKLSEVSLVNFPAYEGARITGVRSLFHDGPEAGADHLEPVGEETPHLEPVDAQAPAEAVATDKQRARIRARLLAKGFIQ